MIYSYFIQQKSLSFERDFIYIYTPGSGSVVGTCGGGVVSTGGT